MTPDISPPVSLALIGPMPPPYDGQSIAFGALVDALRREPNVVVRIVNIADQPTMRRSWGGTLRRIAQYVRVLPSYLRALSAQRVYLTMAQSTGGFARDLVFIWLAAAAQRPVVAHLHGGNYGGFYAQQPAWLQFLIRHTLLRTERIVVLGRGLIGMFDFEPALRARVAVVENGLPLLPSRTGPKSLPHDGPIELLFLSNLIESKGWLDVIAAVRALRDRGFPIRCHFAGQFRTNADDRRIGSVREAEHLFETILRDSKLGDIVVRHGTVSGERKEALLSRCHILALPTAYDNEGQPLCIIEALAYGLPVVTTRYRAIPDLVVEGVTGEFVPFGRHEAIADAVERIARPGRYEQMSAAAIAHYRTGFTWELHMRRLLPFLRGDAPRADLMAMRGGADAA